MSVRPGPDSKVVAVRFYDASQIPNVMEVTIGGTPRYW